MDRLGLPAGDLREPLGGPSGGGGEGDLHCPALKKGDDSIEGGGFAGTRSAGEDHHRLGYRRRDGAALPVGVGDGKLLLENGKLLSRNRLFLRRKTHHQRKPVRGIAFGRVLLGQIDVFAAADLVDHDGAVFGQLE